MATNNKNLLAENDPILDAIFSALGVDEHYLDDDKDAHQRTEIAQGDGVESKASTTESTKTPWVLHVDDDPDMSNALKLRLEAYGVSIIQASNGMQGVRNAFSQPADVVILDYEMPNGRGDYVLERLKRNSITRHIPVFLLTGRKDPRLEARMRSLGAVGFFHKPLKFDAFLEQLGRYIPLVQPGASTRSAAVN